jgi:RNA polymerase sigma-70 factor (ECF subfamily)
MSSGSRSAENLRPTNVSGDSAVAADRSAAAASQWLGEHGDALYRYARARVAGREVAEDLVQETFLAAVEARSDYRGEASMRTWLVSILRRKIVDHYRRGTRTSAPEPLTTDSGGSPTNLFTAGGRWRETPAAWPAPEGQLEKQEFWVVLERCLEKMPDSLSRAFRLRELMGLELAEVCESQRLTAANVRVRLHRARLMLRECLERNWFGEAINKPSRGP